VEDIRFKTKSVVTSTAKKTNSQTLFYAKALTKFFFLLHMQTFTSYVRRATNVCDLTTFVFLTL